MTRNDYNQRIDKAINGTAEIALPETAPIIAMFAANYEPLDEPRVCPDNMSSIDIVRELEDVCSLTTKEVAVVMAYLGFRLYCHEYRGHEWAMAAIEKD